MYDLGTQDYWFKEISARLTNLESQLKNTDKSISTATTRLDNVDKSISTATTRLDNVDKSISTATSRLDNVDKSISTTTSRLDNVDKSISTAASRLDNVDKSISTATTRLDNVDKSISTATSRLDNMDKFISATTSKLNNLGVQLNAIINWKITNKPIDYTISTKTINKQLADAINAELIVTANRSFSSLTFIPTSNTDELLGNISGKIIASSVSASSSASSIDITWEINDVYNQLNSINWKSGNLKGLLTTDIDWSISLINGNLENFESTSSINIKLSATLNGKFVDINFVP